MVIVACLALQSYAVLRPRGARWWPFVDYPMYARSASAGEVLRLRELRARSCDDPPRAWRVEARRLGEQESRFNHELSVIAADRPSAARHRARFARVAAAQLTRRPCALQIWERTVRIGVEGADDALRAPRWTPLREWRVDQPDLVTILAAR